MRSWRSESNCDQPRFDREVLPHLDSAYNLARWLAHSEHEANSILRDAWQSALDNIDQLNANGRLWILSIVRNTAHAAMSSRSDDLSAIFFDDPDAFESTTTEASFMIAADQDMVAKFITELPLQFREVIVLRELEHLSYSEIAEVVGVPMGTVMARLHRARQRLMQRLSDRVPEEHKLGL